MSTFVARKNLILMALTPLLFAGCSMRTVPSTSIAGVKFQGNIHGGEQPVSGAVMQLYDATGGSYPLISSVNLSDSNGNFSLTGDWSQGDCNAPTDQLYIVATGGNPGSGVNDNLVLMTAVGTCANLTASTNVVINEVTTVATISAFFSTINPAFNTGGQYLWDGNATEYANFLALVDPASGIALGGVNQSKLNALANSITPCVNQASTLGDTPQCDQTILQAGYPFVPFVTMDSAVAIISVLFSPTYDPSTVFNYAPTNPSFTPTLSSAPGTWAMN